MSQGRAGFSHYLSEQGKEERLKTLRGNAVSGQWLPIHLVEDLMSLDLDREEHIALLAAVDPTDRLSLEDFLTRGMRFWNQDVASCALRDWVEKTDCLLWHRTLPMSKDPHIPQRLSYTLLDLAWHGAGLSIIKSFSSLDGVDGLSPAFHALLLLRATQWSYDHPTLRAIAHRHVTQAANNTFPDDKALAYAVAYLLRFDRSTLTSALPSFATRGVWYDLLLAMAGDEYAAKESKKLAQLLHDGYSVDDGRVRPHWPALWLRHKLPVDVIQKMLRNTVTSAGFENKDLRGLWECFGGVPSETLLAAVQGLGLDDFLRSLRLLGALFDETSEQRATALLGAAVAQAENPMDILARIPQHYRVIFAEHEGADTVFRKISDERQTVMAGAGPSPEMSFKPLTRHAVDGKTVAMEDVSRHEFFNVVYRGQAPSLVARDDIWSLLTRAHQHPQESQLEELAQKARQMQALFKFCYIKVLGCFVGHDKAALKLMDFVRTSHQDLALAVARALGGIGTPRAHQELVAFLTRPNISLPVKIEVTQILKNSDLTGLQAELRSAINDLNISPNTENAMWELREAITGLLQTEALPSVATVAAVAPTEHGGPQVTSDELDSMLLRKIQDFPRLSSEAKRALRTAQFFHLQVSSAKNLQTIDLSPAIDMQYKALELTFRELFEEACSNVIQRGILQRKLDVIGYARPIIQAMDEFEQYIENLPNISTIPFFSRFKLRKMLRAICQFRPGKRFTLDGLKAFALFFLCFSRKECRFGLQNMFPLPNLTDAELYDFVKCLHIFQDFRNRAAHEGFHPDASNDIEGIWTDTAIIIHRGMMIRDALPAEVLALSRSFDRRPSSTEGGRRVS